MNVHTGHRTQDTVVGCNVQVFMRRLAHGIQRIADQVDKYLLQPIGITPD